MKLWLDTADADELRAASRFGVISGVTTNPSLWAKAASGTDYREVVVEICSIIDGPISAECVAQDVDGLVEEARKIASWHPNIVVKIPLDENGLEAIYRVSKEGIKINTTLIFQPNQALLAAQAGATYVSPFVGRLDDISQEGMTVVGDIVDIFDRYNLPAQVLAASLRHPLHVIQAAQAGAHIATMPYAVFQAMFKHPLTDAGMQKFLEDARKAAKVRT
ncbi:MAG: fructose-6-phosphate aldolase [Chloroflexi bacterium]|nr:fructose-6-phosphate aldolase [Chloroflexota bacterium]